MALYRPDLSTLALDVADCAYGATIHKQRVHQVDVHVPIGSSGQVRLNVYVTAYAATADGNYGDPLPASRVPVRCVPLLVTDAAAVTMAGIVRFRLRTEGLVVNAAGEEIELPAGQSWLDFLDAQPETLLLQNEWVALVRDTQPVVVREFAERFIQLADLPPSSFA